MRWARTNSMASSSKTSREQGLSSPASDRVRRRTRPSSQPSEVWSVFDLTEGFHLAHAVATLHDLGILQALAARPSTADALAKRYRLDRAVLQGVLEYVAVRTDVIRKKGSGFAATLRYGTEARFLFDLYTGAF